MSVKAIKPKKLSISRIDRAVRDGLLKSGFLVRGGQTTFTTTWRHKPNWKEIGPKVRGDDLIWQRVTKDKPYIFVELGTKVRYATMTADFVAKTQPGQLIPGPGRGGVLFINKKVPRPGIKARESNKKIAENTQKQMARIMQNELKKVFK